jgi:hypothetical protein
MTVVNGSCFQLAGFSFQPLFFLNELLMKSFLLSIWQNF